MQFAERVNDVRKARRKGLMEALQFLRTDGLNATLRYSRNSITSSLGIRASRTLFYRLKDLSVPAGGVTVPPGVDVERVVRREQVTGIKRGERLMRLPLERMLGEGGICCILRHKTDLIGFAWLQKKSIYLPGGRCFRLESGEWHLGPTYVHKDDRGRGWNKVLIQLRLELLRQHNARGAFTCTSSENIASVRCLVGAGMEIMGEVTLRRIGRWELGYRLIDYTPDYSLRNRLASSE